MYENNQTLFRAFRTALAEDGCTEEQAKTTADKARQAAEAEGLHNPGAVAAECEHLGCSRGDLRILRRVLGVEVQKLAPLAAPTPPAAPPAPTHITVQADKAPHELRDDELIALFTRDDSDDVVKALEARFGGQKLLVVVGGKVDLELTRARRRDRDDGDTYSPEPGREFLVKTVEEYLDRVWDADPLDGGRLSRAFKARDNVQWPASPEARLFVAYCRKVGILGDQALSTVLRAALSEKVADYPDKLPPFLETARVRFEDARQRRDPLVTACEAELRYQAGAAPKQCGPRPATSAKSHEAHTTRRKLQALGVGELLRLVGGPGPGDQVPHAWQVVEAMIDKILQQVGAGEVERALRLRGEADEAKGPASSWSRSE